MLLRPNGGAPAGAPKAEHSISAFFAALTEIAPASGMTDALLDPFAKTWMTHVFSARAAAEGGIVRRKTADIDRIVGREAFLAELNRRGFRAVKNAGQTVIFCNREPVRVLR